MEGKETALKLSNGTILNDHEQWRSQEFDLGGVYVLT